MKFWTPGRFWALRPRITARRLEAACWISAVALAVGLLQPSAAASATVRAQPKMVSGFIAQDSAAPPTLSAQQLFYQGRCIRRVIAMSQTWPGREIGKEIDRLCLKSPGRPGGNGNHTAKLIGCPAVAGWRPAVPEMELMGCPSA